MMIRITEVLSYDTVQAQLDSGYRLIQCPVCHNEAFDNWAICPHCGWEHDELLHNGYSCANRSYLWWYRLRYKFKRKRAPSPTVFPKDSLLFDPVSYIGALLGATEAGRYYKALSGDPDCTLEEAVCRLAEQMVLYYYTARQDTSPL